MTYFYTEDAAGWVDEVFSDLSTQIPQTVKEVSDIQAAIMLASGEPRRYKIVNNIAVESGISPIIQAANIEAENQLIRALKEEQIKALALSRMGARLPALSNFDTLDLIVTLVQEGALNTPAPGGDLMACRDIYVYAKARIIDARNLPITTVEAYDPAVDGNFPS